MDKLNVLLIFGGKSGEHEVSIVSALSVYKALDKNKYNVLMVGIDKSGRWLLPDQTQLLTQADNPRLIKLNKEKETIGLLPFPTEHGLVPMSPSQIATSQTVARRIDVVMPILHGPHGEDGTVQGLFELANLPYVGAGVLGSAVGMDKAVAKSLLRDAGLPVTPYVVVRRFDYQKNPEHFLHQVEKEFGYPYFVKPANMGSSVGVNKVKNAAEAASKFADAFLYDTKVLVEQSIAARELECSVLGHHEPQASCIGEIIPQHEFYTYEAKYMDENGADLCIPAQISKSQSDHIRELAVRAFQVLECSGMARVDFFLDKDNGAVYINEINTLPGFTSISMYPKLWEASGLAYSKLLDRLIELALERHREKNELKTSYETPAEKA